jgi:diguanylate cyclase (GGDEF)-like protein
MENSVMGLSELFDSVTQMYREEVFRHLLSREVRRAIRYQEPFTICLLKLEGAAQPGPDSPKAKELAKIVASHLRPVLRETDIMGRTGKEFAIVMLHAGEEELQTVVTRIRTYIEDFAFPSALVGPSGKVTISIGAACFPLDGSDDSMLVANAYRSLHEALRQGRNRTCLARET